MLKAIVSMALLGVLTGCGNMQAADPSVEVDIKGHGDEVDLVADAEVIAEAVRDACDIGWLGWIVESPRGVTVTLSKADGSADRVYAQCKTGAIHPLEEEASWPPGGMGSHGERPSW
jgi:hypothetical protein